MTRLFMVIWPEQTYGYPPMCKCAQFVYQLHHNKISITYCESLVGFVKVGKLSVLNDRSVRLSPREGLMIFDVSL